MSSVVYVPQVVDLPTVLYTIYVHYLVYKLFIPSICHNKVGSIDITLAQALFGSHWE